MSNRPRRRLLREWRMLALGLNDAAPPDPDSIQSLEEWNRLHRDVFRFLWREPLRFPNNIRPDAGLIDIQARNMPARNMPELFNPLTDSVPERPEHLREFGNSNDPPFLWEKTEKAIYSALEYLKPARTIARARFIPDPAATPGQWLAPAWPGAPPGCIYFFEDYPARFYRGFRKLRTNPSVVHQYGDDGNPWFQDHGSAVRHVLGLDKRLTEPELYALLALAACWWALRELRRLPETWSRDDLDYITSKVQNAERWLAEAYRLKQADAREATVRDAWAADSHREKSAKGGKAPKGSEGVRLLALALRKEKPGASATALFQAALSRCGSKDNAVLTDLRRLAGGHTITANTEAQLVSSGPDGEPDGLPVGLAGWRKILRRKR